MEVRRTVPVALDVDSDTTALLKECALQGEVSEKADDGRERVGGTGRITLKGDVRDGFPSKSWAISM